MEESRIFLFAKRYRIVIMNQYQMNSNVCVMNTCFDVTSVECFRECMYRLRNTIQYTI